MNEIITGNVPVSVAARVLKVDPQTVRLLLQNKLVDWGVAYKRPRTGGKTGSRQFSYLIYAKPFYEATGYKYEGKQEVNE